jgi:predicted RNA-binding Zn-ribbon protein involved in translation (DUF1610 family)
MDRSTTAHRHGGRWPLAGLRAVGLVVNVPDHLLYDCPACGYRVLVARCTAPRRRGGRCEAAAMTGSRLCRKHREPGKRT